jgi:hypothetical protein
MQRECSNWSHRPYITNGHWNRGTSGGRSAPSRGTASVRIPATATNKTALDGAAAGNGRPYGTRAGFSSKGAQTGRERRAGFVAFSTRENGHPEAAPSPPRAQCGRGRPSQPQLVSITSGGFSDVGLENRGCGCTRTIAACLRFTGHRKVDVGGCK